ncbi:MAG: inositol monophosphatase [Chloroflexi bacterium]|nr:inositol monophosphatase [Chloroflexota bacterium]
MSTLPASRSGAPAIEVAREIVLEAGDILRRRAAQELRVSEKGRANLVTNADVEVENFYAERLTAEFPGHGILGEESGRRGGTGPYTWIVDPLDGTRNYALGLPYYASTIALTHGGEIILGFTYNPVSNEIFWADRGNGAYLNEKRIYVSRRKRLAQCTVGTDMGYSDVLAGHALDLLNRLWPGMEAVRIMGSAALGIAYAACGRTDLYFHHHLSPWDIAAGILITQEAGGVVTDRNGGAMRLETPHLIASNAELLQEFLRRSEGHPWRNG